jgi:hypothetical protein
LLVSSVSVGVVYDFGGLRIQSSFDLPWLVAVSDEHPADLNISLSTALPPTGRPAGAWPGHYRLALEACGEDWLIRVDEQSGVMVADAGRTLRCHCPDPTRLPLLAEIIVRRVLPRLGAFHGRLPIHAASLADDSGAVLLLGSSGAGKSTMTAALALHLGWDIFSDDMSLIGDEGRHTAFASMPGVSLWQASQEALGLPPEDCQPVRSRQGKVWYSPGVTGPRPPQPLEAVILLSIDAEGRGIECQRLTGPSVVVGLFSQLVVFHRRNPSEIARQMDRFKRIATAVPIYGLAYPRDFRVLAEVVDTIRRIRAGALS